MFDIVGTIVDIGYIVTAAVGAVIMLEGFGTAVNFMGDQKTSVWEKLIGVGVMFLGGAIVYWSLGAL